MRWAASEAQMEPSWDRVLCFAAGKSRDTGKTVVVPDIKRSGFLQLICATPDSPFRSLIQSEWHPDPRLSEPTRHSDAKVGKVCDAFGRLCLKVLSKVIGPRRGICRDQTSDQSKRASRLYCVQFRTARVGVTGKVGMPPFWSPLVASFSNPFPFVFRRSDLRRPRPRQPVGVGRGGRARVSDMHKPPNSSLSGCGTPRPRTHASVLDFLVCLRL